MTSGRFWIGGGTCSGKSTLAREFAAATARAHVIIDDTFDEHVAALLGSSMERVATMPVCERLAKGVEQQVHDVWSIAEERWRLIRDDLAADAVVEGEALLPARLAEFGVAADSALFLIVSPKTRRARYMERAWARELVAGCVDPVAAFEAWMRRDDLVQERIVVEAEVHGFPVFEADTADGLAAARVLLVRLTTP